MFFYYNAPCGYCSYFGYDRKKTVFMCSDSEDGINESISELRHFVTKEHNDKKVVFIL